MGFILLRLIVWLVFFHFGVDFWIMPNFFVDSVSPYPPPYIPIE